MLFTMGFICGAMVVILIRIANYVMKYEKQNGLSYIKEEFFK